jgi:hypothetical protein
VSTRSLARSHGKHFVGLTPKLPSAYRFLNNPAEGSVEIAQRIVELKISAHCYRNCVRPRIQDRACPDFKFL